MVKNIKKKVKRHLPKGPLYLSNYFIIAVLIGVLLIFGIVYFFILDNRNSSLIFDGDRAIINENKCGDGICGFSEDCNTCANDCGCTEGENCNNVGLCIELFCGDEICTDEEKNNKNCCIDCGCESGHVCNEVIQQCQAKIDLTEEEAINVSNRYLSEEDLEGKIMTVRDTYYEEELVKEVTIDCTPEGVDYPCQRILFINKNNEIIEEIKSI